MVYLWYLILIILQLLELSSLVTYHRPFRLLRSHHNNSSKNRQSLLSRSVENESEGTDSIEIFLSKELKAIRNPRKSKYHSSKSTRKKSSCIKCKTNADGIYLRPALSCDEWNSNSGTCFLDRNVGATITFSLRFGSDKNHLPSVVWKQEFHLLSGEKTKEFVINPDNSPWNIVLGNKGYEFRISPITEQDVDFNYFSVNLAQSEKVFHPKAKKLHFRIRIVPISYESMQFLNTISKRKGRHLEIEEDIQNVNSAVGKRHSHLNYSTEESERPKTRISNSDPSKDTPFNIFQNTNLMNRLSSFQTNPELQQYDKVNHPSPYTFKPQPVLNRYFEETLDDDEITTSRVLEHFKNKMPKGYQNPESFKAIPRKQSFDDIGETSTIQFNDPKPESFKTIPRKQSFDGFGEISRPRLYDPKPEVFKTIPRKQSFNGFGEKSSIQLNDPKPEIFKTIPRKQSFDDRGETFSTQSNDPKPESFKTIPRKQSFDDIGEKTSPQLSDSKPIENKQKMGETGLGISIVSSALQRGSHDKYSSEDSISKLISECNKNTQCSIHATCINQDSLKRGFCRCVAGFQGNGISCWEVVKYSDSD